MLVTLIHMQDILSWIWTIFHKIFKFKETDSSTTKNLAMVYYWIPAAYSIHSLHDLTPYTAHKDGTEQQTLTFAV